MYNNKQKMLVRGKKPDIFPSNKAITQKDRNRSLRQEKTISNPIRKGFEFVQHLEDNPNATYDDLASEVGISKARVCQMIALCRRLPEEITGYLAELDEPEVLKHFTERKLRPLTLLTTDDEKIRAFHDMARDFMTTLFQDSAGRGIYTG